MFSNLKKQRQSSYINLKVKTVNGNVTNDNDVLTETVQFYKNFYSETTISKEAIERPENVLSKNNMVMCDNFFYEKELSFVIKNFKKDKSPGLDGLTDEFYQKLLEKLKSLYLNMITESFKKGIVPSSIRQPVITLIFKLGDWLLMKNYKPISLTNCDYKILALTLSNRIQKVISKLVSPDQSQYIKKRLVGFNAHLTIALTAYFAIVCLDFEKAFDLLDWNFMVSSLRQSGFGNNFIQGIKGATVAEW